MPFFWALTTEPLLHLPPAIAPRKSSASPAFLPPPPPTVLPKSIAQFSWTLCPSKTDLPGPTPQAISAAGTPAAQITDPTAIWPSSALLWPAAIIAATLPVAVVRAQCHYPCEPVQAGGALDRVNPASTRQVRQGAPCNGAATATAAVGWWGGKHPLHKCQQQPHRVGVCCLRG